MSLQNLDQFINNLSNAIAVEIKALNLKDSEIQTLIDNVNTTIGDLSTLPTTNKSSIVGALTELNSSFNTAIATAVSDLIGGADDENDTLAEIAAKVATLAQTDQGLVSFLQVQTLTDAQSEQARTNIGAAAQTALQAAVDATQVVADGLAALTSRVTSIEAALTNPTDYVSTFNAAKA